MHLDIILLNAKEVLFPFVRYHFYIPTIIHTCVLKKYNLEEIFYMVSYFWTGVALDNYHAC